MWFNVRQSVGQYAGTSLNLCSKNVHQYITETLINDYVTCAMMKNMHTP